MNTKAPVQERPQEFASDDIDSECGPDEQRERKARLSPIITKYLWLQERVFTRC